MVDRFGTRIFVTEDTVALAVRAVELIGDIARESLAARGRFALALCGGSTPEKTYSLLARPERSAAVDWSRTYVFFSDERFVPHGDSRSNFGMARRALLQHVPVPAGHVFPITTNWHSAASAAVAYERQLSRVFSAWHTAETGPRGRQLTPTHSDTLEIPRFDLMLLGLGEDGHTASLFPGAAALEVKDALVTWSLPGVFPPPVDRVTFTFPLLNAARNVIFLVGGESKAAVLHEVLEGSAGEQFCPAKGAHPYDGRLIWIIERAAASKLTPSVISSARK
jgi:6-phosphogluconolactonase